MLQSSRPTTKWKRQIPTSAIQYLPNQLEHHNPVWAILGNGYVLLLLLHLYMIIMYGSLINRVTYCFVQLILGQKLNHEM